MIAVVDYGVNNLASVARALAAAGHPATLTADPDAVRGAERILLPGVGHFGRAAETLRETGLGCALVEAAQAGTPLLGICLGLQLLFGESEEAPGAMALGLLPGRVVRFATDRPVPHVGWAEVRPTAAGGGHPVTGPVFGGAPRFFYHVHSFHPAGVPGEAVLAEGDYDGRFPSVVGAGTVIGAQFHPEKSQRDGLALLDAFARWAP